LLGLQSDLRAVVDPDVLREVMIFHARSTFFFDKKLSGRVNIRLPSDELSQTLSSNDRWMFEGSPAIELPTSKDAPSWKREGSAAAFAENCKISLQELSSIVHNAFATRNINTSLRYYPSAGALFPIQMFLCVLASTDPSQIKTGVYHVLPKSRAIEIVTQASTETLLAPLERGGLPETLRPSMYIVYAMNFDVALFKYGYRGYRFALLEAGAIAMQAELVGRWYGIGSRMWGGFSDYEIAKLCGMDPTVLSPVIVQLMGREAKTS
jgi:SagB-type dehydrogenase family enzyme